MKPKFSGEIVILEGDINSSFKYEIDGSLLSCLTLEELAKYLPTYVLLNEYLEKGLLTFDDFKKVWTEFEIYSTGERAAISKRLNNELKKRRIPTLITNQNFYISPKIVERYLRAKSIKIVPVPTLIKEIGKVGIGNGCIVKAVVCEEYLLKIEQKEIAKALVEVITGKRVGSPPKNFFVSPKLKDRLEEVVMESNQEPNYLEKLRKVLSEL